MFALFLMKLKINYKTENNIYYNRSPDLFMELVDLLENYPCSFGQMLRAKGKKRFLEKHPEYIPPFEAGNHRR